MGIVTRGSLVGFDDCDALVAYAESELAPRLTSSPYPIGGPLVDDMMLRATEVAPTAAGDAADGSFVAEEGSYSATNVQEIGVDEPDLVKTDGERLFTVVNGTIHAVEIEGGEPHLAGTVVLEGGWEHELLLAGDRLFVLAQGEDVASLTVQSSGSIYAPEPSTTMVTEVDVSDIQHPEIVSTRYVEGTYLTARVVDGVARIVVASAAPSLDFVYPSGAGAEDAAIEANQQIIRESSPRDWLPQVLSPSGDGWDSEPLVECDQVSRPEEFSGFGTLSVLSMDLGEPLDLGDAISVMADGETVYASQDALYVATNEWVDPLVIEGGVDPGQVPPEQVEDGYGTSIHKFDISEPGAARYLASGDIDGHLLNQFSMSEQDGVLRVAATTGEPWGSPATSESYVATLSEQDGVLTQLGSVGDLGRGEQIHAVRFIGDQGYVVTFRQTDPLYVIDLSDPANPTMTGELKILGYSAYLHPAGEGRLIGVGQDATEEGQTLGLQISLFDISDPANPTRLQQHSLGSGATSDAEWDHRAFLWWPDQDLAVLPVGSYLQGGWSTGAVGVGVTDQGIVERGRVDHPAADACTADGVAWEQEQAPPTEVPCGAYDDPILRSVVVGDALLTISAGGMGISALDTLAEVAFLGWA